MAAPILLVAMLAMFWVAGAQAVHDDGLFELDKNATASASPGHDWDEVYAAINGGDAKCLTLGAVECAFAADPQGPDGSIFTTGGSKDDLDIPSWRWTSGSVPDADEILNAYAVKYVNPTDSHQQLYFGADRFAVNGAKDFGFWFFQAPVGQNANGTFSGSHTGDPTPGGDDILILGTFTKGGATATVRVFRWVGTGGNATANGTVSGPVGAFADCVPGGANDNGCATVNNGTIATGGWAYVSKTDVGTNMIPSGGFVEGGIDLTSIGLEGCFSSFVAETRSSPSVDATLKDFVLGSFEACGSGLTTTPAAANGTALTDSNSNSLPDTSIGGGSVDVKDSAALVINGTSTWSGTLHFFLCGPIASGTCDGTTNVGTEVGTGTAVSQATTQPILSGAATITAAGRYCWRGFFDSSTNGVPDSTDSSAGECFEVLPVTPTVPTQVSNAGPVPPGTAISDNTTLTGAATPSNGVYGTITFRAYGPDDATCATAVYTSVANVVAGQTAYNSFTDGDGGAFAPTGPGTYRWRAFYAPGAGDTNNLAASGLCGAANESFVVQQFQPTLNTTQTWTVKDKATISVTGGGNLTGTAHFELYDNNACTGTALYTENVPVSGASPQNPETTPFTFTASAATLYWNVSYTSTNASHAHIAATCTENSSLTINN